jgi:hypothetical protein
LNDNEVTETNATESSAESTATGDSDFEAALSEAGVSAADLKGQGVTAEDFDGKRGQAAKQPKKASKEDKAEEQDLIQKLLDEQGEDKAEEGDAESDEDDAEQSEDSDPVLEAINKLKLTDEGEEFKVGSKEELKELVQKGRNYTKKTQAVAQEKKEFETLKTKAIEEYNSSIAELNQNIEAHQQQLQQYQIWDLALASIKQDEPELYDDLIARSKQASKYFQNPVADAQFKAMNDKIAQLESANKSRESELIRRQFDAEFNEQTALTAQLEKELGLKIDRELVRSEWTKTGGTVSKAFGPPRRR